MLGFSKLYSQHKINPRSDPGVHFFPYVCSVDLVSMSVNILSCMRTRLLPLASTLRSEQKGTEIKAEISIFFFYDGVDLHLTSSDLSFVLR